MITPDDLDIGKTYLFEYVSYSGKQIKVIGMYIRSYIQKDTLWFEFKVDGKQYPYHYKDLNNIKLVEL